MEDDDDFCFLLSLILNREGFEVIESKTITEAIHLVNKEHYDLFLVSDEFPDGKGVDFVRQARSLNSDIPIVLISGWASSEYIEEGLEAGASAYLIKPVENQNVIQTVKGLLTSSVLNAA